MKLSPQANIVFTAIVVIASIIGIQAASHFGILDSNLASTLTTLALGAGTGTGIAYSHDVVAGK